MHQIFVFTAGNLAAREHLNDSIKSSVSSTLLDKHLPVEQASYLKSLLAEPSGVFAWGAVPGPRNKPTWDSMQVGDIALTVYENRYRYVSTVIAKLHQRALAEEIWGKDDEGQTWEYMYLLSQPQEIDVPVLASPVKDLLNAAYRGFVRISDAKISAIVDQYGSVDNFVSKEFGASLPPTIIESELQKAENDAAAGPGFDPQNLVDARKKVLAEVVRRRGQPKFRKALLDAYGGRCAVTGCDVETVLEAAHIVGYAGDDTNHVTNGILLRGDVHTLFDLGLLKIEPTGIIHLDESLAGSIYGSLLGKNVNFPSDSSKAPSVSALAHKFSQVL